MKQILHNIHNAFDNRHRFAIMKMLTSMDWTGFNQLKFELDMTDGNLASHLAVLIGAGFIDKRKDKSDGRTQTVYAANLKGRRAFNEHSKAMKKLIEFEPVSV